MKRKREKQQTKGEKRAKITPLRFISWNVNGLRAQLSKGSLQQLLSTWKPDIVCLQEIKLQPKHIATVQSSLDSGYSVYWNCCEECKGQAGVALSTLLYTVHRDVRSFLLRTALLSLQPPLHVSYGLSQSSTGGDGRVLVAEYPNWYLVTVYFPQPGNHFERLSEKIAWEKDFQALSQSLQKGKPVICLGDFNTITSDLDCPKKHLPRLTAHFDRTEIDSFRETVAQLGWRDGFRALHPEDPGFTYYSARDKKAREKGNGWRLDYSFFSSTIFPALESCMVLDTHQGSDHFPLLVALS